ncbi:AT-hook motif nuclear-localized protein 17 [Senna tora]|uniref:AT-hook motif nuclear-localized protein 17 n=1 Tax=Senna tora TaxID=362788 RepID=A0A834WHA7_9FABA|nr:AT-hook motif nuclear-localized protein 17 [Senna tora]
MMRRSNETAIISSTAEGKRPKGRPKGSKNKPKPALLASSVSVSDHMAPYLLQVPHGNDVVQAISQFSRRKNIGICVLSASGTVFNAAVRSSAALPAPDVTCPDRYLILSISAAFLPHQSLTSPTALKPLTVSLVAPSGHVVGGLVSGQLLAAGPVFVIATSFNNPIHYTLQSNEEDDAQNTAVASGGESEHAPPPNPLSDGMALYYNHHDSLQLPFAQWALGSNNGFGFGVLFVN